MTRLKSTAFTALISAAVAAVLVMLTMAGCGRIEPAGDEDDVGRAARPRTTRSSDGDEIVRLTPEQVEKAGIELATAGPGKLRIELSLPGQIVVDPDAVAQVATPVSGVVRTVHKRLGDHVTASETLLVLDSAELARAKGAFLGKDSALALARIDLERALTIQANTGKMLDALGGDPSPDALVSLDKLDLGANRGELLTAYAEYISSKAANERQRMLSKDNLASGAEVQAAQGAYQKALALYMSARDELRFATRRAVDERTRGVQVATLERDAAARQLQILGLSRKQIEAIATEPPSNLSHLELASPIDGFVMDRQAVMGQLLRDDARPFVITNLDRVVVQLTVFPNDSRRVAIGQTVELTDGQGGAAARGTITSLTPSRDETTRSVIAQVPITNPQARWLPGTFVTGRTLLQELEVPLLVPVTALQTINGRTCVFVQRQSGFEAEPVTTGRSNATHVQIISGLQTGQRYVVSGSFVLKAELGKSGVEDKD